MFFQQKSFFRVSFMKTIGKLRFEAEQTRCSVLFPVSLISKQDFYSPTESIFHEAGGLAVGL